MARLEKTTTIRRTAVRETGVSLYHEGAMMPQVCFNKHYENFSGCIFLIFLVGFFDNIFVKIIPIAATSSSLRVREANEVPISSRKWVASLTFR